MTRRPDQGRRAIGVAAAESRASAARRAPAYAQGTKLHVVRWVDFIPEGDVELKRQGRRPARPWAPRSSRVHQRQRRAAPHHRRDPVGRGADIVQMLHNWPHLYDNGLVDVSTWPSGRQGPGRLLRCLPGDHEVGGRWLALPHGIVRNAIAYRKSWFDEIGVTSFPKTLRGPAASRQEAQEEGPSARPDARPHVRRRAGLGLSPHVELRRHGDGQERQDRHRQQGLGGRREVHGRRVEGRLRRGWARVGRHQQQPRLPRGELSSTLNGASIYIAAKRQKDKLKDDKGEPLFQDIEHAPLPPKGPAGQFAPRRLPARHHEALEESEARQGLPQVASPEGELREVVRGRRGVYSRRDQGLGREPDVVKGRQAAPNLPTGGEPNADAGLSRDRPQPRRPSRTRSTSSWTCTPRRFKA